MNIAYIENVKAMSHRRKGVANEKAMEESDSDTN